jgi:ATPase subunit of ABC transporter with duplicated ATPase domains
LRHLKNQFEELDFRGIAQVRNLVKLPLRRVFVPLSAEQELERETKEERQQGAKSDVSRLEELAVEQAEKERRVALKQLVTDNPYLAILGDPGSGKSTTLKYICLMFAENEAETQLGLEPQWLPIFFPTHRRLLRNGVKRNRKRLRALRRGYRDGKFSREKVNASVQAWLGHVRHGHTWGLRRALFGNIFS